METLKNSTETEFQPIELHGDKIHGKVNNLIQENKFSEAVEVVEQYIDAHSGSAPFMMVAAQAYKGIQDYKKESDCLSQLVSMSDKPRYSILLAESLAQQNDFPQALKVLHKILDEADSMAPILFEVYKNMGNIYLKCGDIEAAEDSYNKANGMNSQDENLMVNYGVLAIQKGEYDNAKQRFTDVLAMNNSSDLAWVGMALVHRAHGDFDLSRACLLRGLDDNPYNKLAISNYYQWSHQDNIDTTSEIMESYLEAYPGDVEMQNLSNSMSH